MFYNNDFEQFQLRQQEMERQAEQERKVNDARRWQNMLLNRQQKRQQSKRTSLLTRISVLF